MQPDEIHINDWSRILFGEVPATFFIEVIIRSAFLYTLLVAGMRLMGRRMAAQLSRNERAAMVSFAAAIGVPLQAPDRGLLPALAIGIVVVLLGRMLAIIAFRNQTFEKATQGNIDILVTNGVLDFKNIKRIRLTRDRIFAALRGAGITQLGQVKRMYMEAPGAFTCVKAEDHTVAGLSVIPHWDNEFYNNQHFKENIQVCSCCGAEWIPNSDACYNCGESTFEKAVSDL